MVERVIIDINGSTLPFNALVDKLRTSEIGSGSVLWVPDESTQRVPLDVNANGTYNAADSGVYGYGTVSVSVKGTSVTGKGKDGKTHQVTVDEYGFLRDSIID